jgi:hypothetical protein
VDKIFILLACHFLGDFSLQSEFMAENKQKHPFVMCAHSFIWAFAMYMGFWFIGYQLSILCIGILIGGHWVIDKLDHPFELYGGAEFGFDFVMHVLQILGVYGLCVTT